MSFYINENSIRKGNRGGKENFNWEDVRLLNYKDRECYLGISDKIGYLDKGYMWKKNDWWMKKNKNNSNEELEELDDERKRVIEMEEKEYNKYLSKDNNSKNNVNQFEFKEKKEDEKRNKKSLDKLLITNIKKLLGIKRENKK